MSGHAVVSSVAWRHSMTARSASISPGGIRAESLAAIYKAEITRLASLGAILAGPVAAGEDLAQDTFLQLARRLHQDRDYLA
jgi:hypothetical protein